MANDLESVLQQGQTTSPRENAKHETPSSAPPDDSQRVSVGLDTTHGGCCLNYQCCLCFTLHRHDEECPWSDPSYERLSKEGETPLDSQGEQEPRTPCSRCFDIISNFKSTQDNSQVSPRNSPFARPINQSCVEELFQPSTNMAPAVPKDYHFQLEEELLADASIDDLDAAEFDTPLLTMNKPATGSLITPPPSSEVVGSSQVLDSTNKWSTPPRRGRYVSSPPQAPKKFPAHVFEDEPNGHGCLPNAAGESDPEPTSHPVTLPATLTTHALSAAHGAQFQETPCYSTHLGATTDPASPSKPIARKLFPRKGFILSRSDKRKLPESLGSAIETSSGDGISKRPRVSNSEESDRDVFFEGRRELCNASSSPVAGTNEAPMTRFWTPELQVKLDKLNAECANHVIE